MAVAAAVALTGACGSSTVTSIAPSPARCEISLTSATGELSAGGGTMMIAVSTAAECAWTAAAQAPWITRLAPDRGQGPASLLVEAAPNAGPPRSTSLTIADQSMTIRQASGCTYAVEPLTLSIGSQGETAAISIDTHDECVWTAASEVPWITVAAGSAGAGGDTVHLSVAHNTTPVRQGVVRVAGQAISVEQATGCTYVATPDSISVTAAGGELSVAVGAGDGCTWTVTVDVPWIAHVSPPAGVGSGVVSVGAAANTGPSRSGTLVVEGQVVTIVQANGCTYALSTSSLTFNVPGGTRIVSISTAPGCSWTATTSDPSWLRVGPSAGTSSGSVTVGATPSIVTRTGTVTIAGHQVTVRQN